MERVVGKWCLGFMVFQTGYINELFDKTKKFLHFFFTGH